jgi:chemotaxis protein MotB
VDSNKDSKKETPALAAPAAPGGISAGQQQRRWHRRLEDVGSEEDAKVAIWMITFTDVMGLMLTFFVMLFALSEPEEQTWAEASSALNSEFNRYQGQTFTPGPVEALNLDRIDFDRALDIPYLEGLMEVILSENPLLKDARIIKQPGELIISMPQDLLFDPADAEIKENGIRALYALGGSLTRIKNKIEIIGHADPRAMTGENPRYSSNWELSLARAANVAGVLNSVGYERDIDIKGLSSGRYHDLQGIGDEEARLELARRVDIIIKNHDGRKSEVFFDPRLP